MKYLQGLLVLIGSVCLGTVVGFFALVAVAASMQKPTGEPWQRGYGQYMGGLLCGAPLGALSGFVLGIALMSHERWGIGVWLGIVVGLLCGPLVVSWLNIQQAFGWVGMAVVIVACGMMGGLIAGIVSSLRDR